MELREDFKGFSGDRSGFLGPRGFKRVSGTFQGALARFSVYGRFKDVQKALFEGVCWGFMYKSFGSLSAGLKEFHEFFRDV